MTRHNRRSKKYRGGFSLGSMFGSDSASGTESMDPKTIISNSTKQIEDLLGKITDAVGKLPDPVVQQTGQNQEMRGQNQQVGQQQVVGGRRRRRRTHRKRR